jgi:prepilin-type N-terminal cleavage/methylation domain-containing protein
MTSTRNKYGFSLLELLAVVTIMGILSAVVIARNGRSMVENFGSQGSCRKVALALIQAKRRAITTGMEHAVDFSASGGKSYFSIYSIDSGGTASLIDGPMPVSDDVVLTTSHSRMSFNFEGQAAGAYWLTLRAVNRLWRIDVIPITGALQTTETKL